MKSKPKRKNPIIQPMTVCTGKQHLFLLSFFFILDFKNSKTVLPLTLLIKCVTVVLTSRNVVILY